MMWVELKGNPLPKAGKYVVKTERSHYGLKGKKLYAKLEANCTIHIDKQTGEEYCTWGVTNQVVTHYLWEG